MSMPDDNNNPEPTTAEILAEVNRRRAQASPPVGGPPGRIVMLADRFIFWVSKRWVAIANSLAILYIGLPILAPVLMQVGLTGPAALLYGIYEPLCNQLPQRSWFLFGPQATYTFDELAEHSHPDAQTHPWDSGFTGDAAFGYKIALCERCTAMHLTIVAVGLIYAVVRRKKKIRPLPWWAYVALFVPMALDGGFQLLSYLVAIAWPSGPISPHETSAFNRLVTGSLAGFATVWLAYPYLDEAMEDLRNTLSRRFGWE